MFQKSLIQHLASKNVIQNNKITGKTETVDGVSTAYVYSYDSNNRLTQVRENGNVTHTWAYDANGNRTHADGSLIATYDDQDRLLSYNGNNYQYTAIGELTEKTDSLNSTTQYNYDVFSNLRSVTLPDGTDIDYIIDGQNRRVGKKRNGTLDQGFLYQGQLNHVAELNGSNNVIARFVYADKGHVPSYMIKSGTHYRIISDHLGSVRLVVNANTGDIAQRLDYDAWGNVTNDTNPGFQPFGYAGGIYDRDTNLVRFGARDYDPEIGRWTTKDPIGFAGGLNHYGYVNGDPVQFVDPNGLDRIGYSSAMSANLNCPAVSNCIDSYDLYDNVGQTLPTKTTSDPIESLREVFKFVKEKSAQATVIGTVCSVKNRDQCNGYSPYVPWVYGMDEQMYASDLPNFPTDGYFDGQHWVDSEGNGVDWFPLYESYKEGLYCE